MCRSRPEWVHLVWTPGLVTRCEKVCRLFRHNSDPVFCSQRYFPEIFQISVTKDQAYESPISYAIYVFASLLGDVATGCEKKKNLLPTIQLFSIASEIILQLWHFGILNCVSWRKTWINQCKKICEKFKVSYLSWLHYETSFSFLCFIGEKSFLATNYFQFWFDQLSTPRLVSTSIHVPVRSYFWLHYNATVFILLANVERCTAELKLERYKRRREIHIAMRPTLVPSWFAWTKHCKSTHLCDSTIE